MAYKRGAAASTPTTPSYASRVPGYIRFKKFPLDPSCFDMEESLQFLATERLVDDKGKNGIGAQAVYIVDPCQLGSTPLKTATLLSLESTPIAGAGVLPPPASGQSYAGIAVLNTQVMENAFGTFFFGQTIGAVDMVVTSLVNTAKTVTIEKRNLTEILAIHMVASAGTATLLVEASADNSTFLQIDSIAAAAATDLQYTLATNALNGAAQAGSVAGTGISTVKLNPLAYRFLRITMGAAGAGNTTTMSLGIK